MLESGYNRVIVSEPPRHGKSELCSRALPAWFAGTFPDKRVMLASYEASFAASWGRKSRDIFEAWAPELWSLELDPKVRAEDDWGIRGHSGGMTTAGVGGGVTGKGADLLIIDDPIKNAEEARSQTMRDKAWEWFTSVAYTRLEPGGLVIIIMTRWHEDDIVGRLLKQQKEEGIDGTRDHWVYFNLPGIAKAGDLIGREPGEALWPERYDKEDHERIRGIMGSFWYSAQYDGNPIPEGGTIFKQSDFQYFTIEAEYFVLYPHDGNVRRYQQRDCMIFQTIDPSLKTKDINDFFVISTFVVTPDADLLLLHVFREKVSTVKHTQVARNMYRRFEPFDVTVEEQAGGLNVVEALKAEGLPFIGVHTDTDKVSRARTAAARFEVGKFYFLRGMPNAEVVEHELVGFPLGAHDDIVDTISAAAVKLITMGGGIAQMLKSKRKRQAQEVTPNGRQKQLTIRKEADKRSEKRRQGKRASSRVPS